MQLCRQMNSVESILMNYAPDLEAQPKIEASTCQLPYFIWSLDYWKAVKLTTHVVPFWYCPHNTSLVYVALALLIAKPKFNLPGQFNARSSLFQTRGTLSKKKKGTNEAKTSL
jgi:hypothetical protein